MAFFLLFMSVLPACLLVTNSYAEVDAVEDAHVTWHFYHSEKALTLVKLLTFFFGAEKRVFKG